MSYSCYVSEFNDASVVCFPLNVALIKKLLVYVLGITFSVSERYITLYWWPLLSQRIHSYFVSIIEEHRCCSFLYSFRTLYHNPNALNALGQPCHLVIPSRGNIKVIIQSRRILLLHTLHCDPLWQSNISTLTPSNESIDHFAPPLIFERKDEWDWFLILLSRWWRWWRVDVWWMFCGVSIKSIKCTFCGQQIVDRSS